MPVPNRPCKYLLLFTLISHSLSTISIMVFTLYEPYRVKIRLVINVALHRSFQSFSRILGGWPCVALGRFRPAIKRKYIQERSRACSNFSVSLTHDQLISRISSHSSYCVRAVEENWDKWTVQNTPGPEQHAGERLMVNWRWYKWNFKRWPGEWKDSSHNSKDEQNKKDNIYRANCFINN